LAEYLIKENDVGLLSEIISHFDRDLLFKWTSNTPDFSDEETSARLDSIVQAASDFSRLMRTVYLSDLNLVEYKRAIFLFILEKWPMIIGWLTFLLLRRPLDAEDRSDLIDTCLALLAPALGAFNLIDSYEEELLCIPCTIKFILFLLCQTDPEPGEGLPAEQTSGVLGSPRKASVGPQVDPIIFSTSRAPHDTLEKRSYRLWLPDRKSWPSTHKAMTPRNDIWVS
jgi:hypothetical protein